jgi:hypothetical protein
MFDVLADIHWVGVLAATATFAVLGGIYFGALVPRQYVRALGREHLPAGEQQGSGPLFIAGPLVCSLVTVLASALLIAALGVTGVGDALLFGLITGLGYLVPMAFTIAINPAFPHPLRYGLLNAPYFLVSQLVASVLLVVIPW